MVQVAIILAGGLGSRLKEHTKEKPKGFLEIDGKSLIKRSLEKLFMHGIKKVFIGTGYLSEFYEELATQDERISTILNPIYDQTSSMYTLYNMRNDAELLKRIGEEGFLLLESDLLYESAALTQLLEDERKDIILSSGETGSNDEVYIQADADSFLVNLSKNANDLEHIYSELVGISKVSTKRYSMMNETFQNIMDQQPKVDYEHIMAKTSLIDAFFVKKINDLIWCEIDDINHYQRALTQILPRIK